MRKRLTYVLYADIPPYAVFINESNYRANCRNLINIGSTLILNPVIFDAYVIIDASNPVIFDVFTTNNTHRRTKDNHSPRTDTPNS